MKDNHKKGNVKRHKGNPHGNAPDPRQRTRGESNHSDRLREEGVNPSERSKQ